MRRRPTRAQGWPGSGRASCSLSAGQGRENRQQAGASGRAGCEDVGSGGGPARAGARHAVVVTHRSKSEGFFRAACRQILSAAGYCTKHKNTALPPAAAALPGPTDRELALLPVRGACGSGFWWTGETPEACPSWTGDRRRTLCRWKPRPDRRAAVSIDRPVKQQTLNKHTPTARCSHGKGWRRHRARRAAQRATLPPSTDVATVQVSPSRPYIAHCHTHVARRIQ